MLSGNALRGHPQRAAGWSSPWSWRPRRCPGWPRGAAPSPRGSTGRAAARRDRLRRGHRPRAGRESALY
ncbi:hypothetical protein QJS66_14680 [Kocuria rhizophila]|nr:hypothetical protein QJS66_14680 [Kocuria rhizophila]